MDVNPVIALMGRRLRLAVVGGGPGSFIGEAHRIAARLDDRYELVASALSSDPQRSRTAGRAIGVEPARAYPGALELLDAEAERGDGADVVAVMTPNDTHHQYSIAALDRGFDVICDKPLANTLSDALDIVDRVESSGLVFCLTHNYSGYPLVRQARAMVTDGQLGEMRLIQVEYVQGGKAAPADPGVGGEVPWRLDPDRSGPSMIMGDIGTHAHHLVRYITGCEVTEVAAEIGNIVPGRRVDDYGGALLRFHNGARGTMWVTQAAAGVENGIRVRVSGSRGSLEWMQDRPTRLLYHPLGAPAEVRTPNGPGTLPLAARSSRLAAGHPEGFHEGFANLYADAAEAIAARRSDVEPDPLALHFPTALDGAWGMRFVEAALASSESGGGWVDASLVRDTSSREEPG